MAKVWIAPISFGLGDLIVSLPAIQALIHGSTTHGEEVWLVARSAAQTLLAERITGLAGCVDEGSFDPTRDDGQFVDLRDHQLQRDFWWGSDSFVRAFGALDINGILGRICDDFGIEADFTTPIALEASTRPELGDTVLLVTETDGPAKVWAPEKWVVLAAEVRNLGLEVGHVVRDEIPSVLQAMGIPDVRAATPGDAVDVLTSCRAVIGIDTGLTHIAAQQGTPTVTVCRAATVYHRPWPHCRVLRGGRCTPACIAAEERYAYNGRVSLHGFHPAPRVCPAGAPCLEGIDPVQALALLEALL
jgi:hypothetical protein